MEYWISSNNDSLPFGWIICLAIRVQKAFEINIFDVAPLMGTIYIELT